MLVIEQENKKVYSDGQETEKNMLEIATAYPEDLAEDYISNNSSYTLNNTFSSVRKNILNWYPFKKDVDILEVGAGMGSITGILCDKAKSVTSIEMNQIRADVIRARYKDRKNLTVISENINTWETEQRFDYVVFIGVLEYAAIFSDAFRPFDEFLNSVKKLLKDDGKVLFAIENRFGLKYWLGAAEDHLQKPFVGVEGYKEPKTARTFSKSELETILDRVGLSNHRFYSVLPDYKFPELIFSEEYTPDYMNLKKVSFTYSKGSTLYANEKDLYKDIIENGMFANFANSFLVEASKQELDERHVVHVSAKGEVYKEYRVSTVIYSDGDVCKIPMHQNAVSHINRIVENTEYLKKRGVSILSCEVKDNIIHSKLYKGNTAQDVFRTALNNNDKDTLYCLLDALKESLRKSSDTVEYNINNMLEQYQLAEAGVDYGEILQKAFVDMTFYNAFWENEQLIFFDQEWCFERVPLKFCLYYSVKSAYTKADASTQITFDELMEYLEIQKAEYRAYEKLEEIIWSKVLYRQTDFYGAEGYCNRWSEESTLEYYHSKIQKKYDELEGKIVDQANIISEKNSDIEELNNSLNKKISSLEEKNREISYQSQKIEELEQIIRNKEGHIELLLEVERAYELEKTSRTYKVASIFRKISLFLLPANSKRRFFAHMFIQALRHPRHMLQLVNMRRIKSCFKILSSEDGAAALQQFKLVEEYERSRQVQIDPEKIDIVEVSEAEKRFEDYEPLVFPEYDKPMVSIVIPVYNQFDYTYHCLESILKNSGDCTYEVIIANDCSTDLTTRLQELVTGIQVITNEKNLRFLLNCNNAAKYARGSYILFLNNDTQVQSDWLQPLIDLMHRDEKIGMVGSKLVYADGYLQEAGGILWKDASAWNYGNRQNPNDSEFNYVCEADYISGAAIMIRTSLWKEIGGFDERFAPAYCEDSDLAFEVRKHGYKVMYQPKSVVVHFEGISNGTDVTTGQKKYQVDNQVKFYDKWKDELEKQHFENGTNVFVARDRSKDRKHVLFIDHYVPQYDQDAGSKTTFMYLKMLVSKGYQITFLGDNFYQHEPYTTELQQLGIFVLYGPKYAEHWQEWLLENINYFDVFYLNRPHISVKYIDFIKSHAKGKVIYYGHDLHFLRTRREYELSGDRKLLEESEEWLQKEFSLMHKADISYYPSTIECDEIYKVDPSIKTKAITAYVFEKFNEFTYDANRRKGLLFVGGFGHGPNLDAVLWFLENIFPELYERTKAPFYIVGSKAPKEITSIKTEGVIVKGFVSEEELQELYQTCRMAIVPLRYGAGVKGKVVEALYYGIPIVTTSVGAEGIEGIEDIAIVKDEPQDIIEAVAAVYNDGKKLKDMSEMSLEFVKKKFSVDAVWDIVKEDFS